MPYPNKATRFPVNRKDHTKKGPYLMPLLKRFLKKQISFEDPETQKIIRGRVKDAVVWRLILNATQGDNIAIKEIFDRLDGKVAQELPNSGVTIINAIYGYRNKSGDSPVWKEAGRLSSPT